MIQLLVILFLIFFVAFTIALLLAWPNFIKAKPSYYQLYHTAEAISDKWYDAAAVGLCDHCGMDDSPIVTIWAGEAKCKWCAEFDNITWHVKNKGRFETEAKLNPTSYPPKPPGGSGGGSPAPKSMGDQISEVVTQIGTDYKALNERLRKLEEENELLRAQTAHVRDVEVTEIHNGAGQVVRRILSERFEPVATIYSDNIKYVNLVRDAEEWYQDGLSGLRNYKGLLTPNEQRGLEAVDTICPTAQAMRLQAPEFDYPKY